MRPAPPVAKWLLTRLAPSTPESVLGDLEEEYEAGRSTGWYWRQVCRAIVTSTARQMTAHPVLTVRAVFVGWVLLWIFFEYVFQLLISPEEWLFVRGVADIRSWWPNITPHIHTLRGSTSATAISIVAPLGCAGAGWIVARFHKREMVLIFIITILAWNLMGITHAFWQSGLRQGWLISIIVNFAVVPVSIMVGGVFTARTEVVE